LWTIEVGVAQPRRSITLARTVFDGSSRSVPRDQPTKHEEVAATQGAPVRQKNPVESPLDQVPYSHDPEIHGSAMRTAGEEHG
jgi:hypothetical protein